MRVFLLTFLSILVLIYCQDASNLKQINADQFISEKKRDEDQIKKYLDSIFSVGHEKGRNDTTIPSEDKSQTSFVQIKDVSAVPEKQEDNNTTTSEEKKEFQDEINKLLDSIFSVDHKNGANDTTITSKDEHIKDVFTVPERREENNSKTPNEEEIDKLVDIIFSNIPEKGRNDSTITSEDEAKNQTSDVQIKDVFTVPERRKENNSTTPDQDEIDKLLDSIFSIIPEKGRNNSTIASEDEAKNQTSDVQNKDVFAVPERRKNNNTKTIENNEDDEEQRLEILIKSIFTVDEEQEKRRNSISVKFDQDQKQKVLTTTDSGIFVFPGEEHLYYKRIKSRMSEITSSEKVHSGIIFSED